MTSNNIDNITKEIKNTTDEQLKKTIEKWYEKIHTQSLKIGASYISTAVVGVMEKHLKKGKDASRRDLERCVKDIMSIVSVQLNTQQNDSTTENKINEQESSI